MASEKETNGADGKEWTYKDWYERNKGKLAARRKARYHSDKKYRKNVLKQNRKYQAGLAKEREEAPKPRVRIPKHRRPVEMSVEIGGSIRTIDMVHIGSFARAIGRSVPTIHQWERRGLLPRTPYLLQSKNKQERLYTEDMIRVVREVLVTRGPTVSASDSMFRQEILDGWRAAGIAVLGE